MSSVSQDEFLRRKRSLTVMSVGETVIVTEAEAMRESL